MAKEKKIIRTMRIPVAEIIEGGTKAEFYEALRASLKLCTQAYNRCFTEYWAKDAAAIEAAAQGEKIPKFDAKAAYRAAYHTINKFFVGSTGIAAAIQRSSQGFYKDHRFQILMSKESLPTQRSSPVPLLKSKYFAVEVDSQNNLIATVWLPSNNSKWKVRLKGGSNYRKQLKTVRERASSGSFGDSQIWIDQKRGNATLGIACKLTPKASIGRSGAMLVSTSCESFIIATKANNETPFAINGDHAKGWQVERRKRMQRLRQDRKAGAVKKKRVNEQMDILATKFRNRIESFICQTVAAIVEHAKRRRVAKIEYCDLVRSYFGSHFPYFEFALRLKHRCEADGIEFEQVKPPKNSVPKGARPHVYCDVGIDKVTGEIRNTKIGKSTRAIGNRSRDDSRAKDQDWLTLWINQAVDSQHLSELEKHYLALFAAHRIGDGNATEMFASEPIIQWSRETGRLGNAGNLSQIAQYIEV